MNPRKQRLPFRDLSTLTGEDRETADKNQINGQVINIFRVLMNHPALARRWMVFAAHVLGKSTLPPRDRELAILRIGWLNQAPYEWEQHVIIGKRSGISDAEIEQIQKGAEGRMEPARRRDSPGRRRPVRELSRIRPDMGHACGEI